MVVRNGSNMLEQSLASQKDDEGSLSQPARFPVLVIESDTELSERPYKALETAGYPVVFVHSENNLECLFESLLSPSLTHWKE